MIPMNGIEHNDDGVFLVSKKSEEFSPFRGLTSSLKLQNRKSTILLYHTA